MLRKAPNKHIIHLISVAFTLIFFLLLKTMFEQQLKREKTLERQILLFTDAMKGLGCDNHKWWQDSISHAERARCQKYRQDLTTLQKLEWEYYIPCYGGPGHDCDQEIPKLEARFGSWLDNLEESQAVCKVIFPREKQ